MPDKHEHKDNHDNDNHNNNEVVESPTEINLWAVASIILGLILVYVIFAGGLKVDEPVTAADGKVTIYEYSDFQCPFCYKGYEVMKQVKAAYGDNVEIIFKHFPLSSIHPQAQKASEAAECARDQEKFWEMHDMMFEDQRALSIDDLKRYAKDLGLETAKFDACLDSGAKTAAVSKDMDEGELKGVRGTPAFFVGTTMISGAQPFEAFKTVIDKQLSGEEDAIESEQPEGDGLADTSNDPEVELMILNDKGCMSCETDRVVEVTKLLFPTVNVKEVDYNSAEGKELAKKYAINALPAYMFDEKIDETANFAEIEKALEKKDAKYVIIPAAVGIGKVLEPKEGNSAAKGSEDAPVTIIEFSEFQCPYCGRWIEESYGKLKKEYIDTGKVRIVFRHFPLNFHPYAQKAAEATECARDQGKFWEMHDMLWENTDGLDADSIKGYAKVLGLKSEEFDGCLDSGKHEAKIEQDMVEGVEMGVGGTPAFFVNGMLISGAQPFENFQALIEAALAE